MEVTVRRLRPSELEEAVRVEESAIKGFGYLRDTAELFFSDEVGAMLGAFKGEELVGIAKYTVLPDRTAWLETLRVAPEHQRQGVGTRLYEEFVSLSRSLGIETAAMYTGLRNVPSAALARKFGLDTAGKYREFQLSLDGVTPPEAETFEPVGEAEACALLAPLAERYEGYAVLNRTFMRMNDDVFRAFAREGKVLVNCESGSVMVFGNRFLERRSVQIAVMAGDLCACMDYAVKTGLERGVPQVVATAPLDDEAMQSVLADYGFRAAGDLQVMSGRIARVG